MAMIVSQQSDTRYNKKLQVPPQILGFHPESIRSPIPLRARPPHSMSASSKRDPLTPAEAAAAGCATITGTSRQVIMLINQRRTIAF
jgi:hypothetical protein